jgi:hypothetical protein
VQADKQAVPPAIIHRLKTPVKVDGACDPQVEYADASFFDYPDAFQTTGRVYLKHDDHYLYVCLRGAAGQLKSRFASIYLDADNLGEVFATTDDISLRANIVDGTTSAFRGSGGPNGYVPAFLPGWSAATSAGNADVAEYAIPLMLTGGTCGSPFGLASYHHWVQQVGDDYGWPSNHFFDQPQTWATVAFADAPCTPSGGLVWQKVFLPLILR